MKIDLKIVLYMFIMATQIVNASSFSVNESIVYTKPKINNSGGKSIGIINTQSKKSLLVQTPLMMNWGVNIYENQGGGNSYDISLQFPRDEFSNESINQLLNMLTEFEDKIKNDAKNNSKEWFGKQNMSSEVVDALWSPMLKYPKDSTTGEPDKTRSPTIKIKLPVWEGEHKYELYDINKKQLIPNDDNITPDHFIQKGSNIACIIQCGGIWFANGKFGVTWKLYQGIVKPVENLEQGKCHIQISLDEENTIRNEKTEPNEKQPNIYDSDGEDEEEQDDGESQKDTQQPEEEIEEEEEPEIYQEEVPVEKPKPKVKKNKKTVK